jgi:hypothetical protein
MCPAGLVRGVGAGYGACAGTQRRLPRGIRRRLVWQPGGTGSSAQPAKQRSETCWPCRSTRPACPQHGQSKRMRPPSCLTAHPRSGRNSASTSRPGRSRQAAGRCRRGRRRCGRPTRPAGHGLAGGGVRSGRRLRTQLPSPGPSFAGEDSLTAPDVAPGSSPFTPSMASSLCLGTQRSANPHHRELAAAGGLVRGGAADAQQVGRFLNGVNGRLSHRLRRHAVGVAGPARSARVRGRVASDSTLSPPSPRSTRDRWVGSIRRAVRFHVTPGPALPARHGDRSVRVLVD